MTKTQTMTTQTKMTTTTVAAGVATMDHGIFLQPEFVMQCEVKSSSTGIPHRGCKPARIATAIAVTSFCWPCRPFWPLVLTCRMRLSLLPSHVSACRLSPQPQNLLQGEQTCTYVPGELSSGPNLFLYFDFKFGESIRSSTNVVSADSTSLVTNCFIAPFSLAPVKPLHDLMKANLLFLSI